MPIIRLHSSGEGRISIQNALTLIFSAKESLFKALYPSVGYYFDFKDAEITEVNYTQTFLKFRLLKSLGARSWLQKNAEHEVEFFLRDDSVYTRVLIPI